MISRAEHKDKLIERLIPAIECEVRVADILRKMGYKVINNNKPGMQTTEVDNGDLLVWDKNLDNKEVVGVKHRTIDFTCADDFPYKDGLLAWRKEAFDIIYPIPFLQIVVNRNETHWGLIYTSTKKHWTIKKVYDKYYGESYYEYAYLCPLEHVKFRRIDKHFMKEGI